MAKSKKPKVYKVWIHLEGCNNDGDCIEGDEYHEPLKAFETRSIEMAESVRRYLCSTVDDLEQKTAVELRVELEGMHQRIDAILWSLRDALPGKTQLFNGVEKVRREAELFLQEVPK